MIKIRFYINLAEIYLKHNQKTNILKISQFFFVSMGITTYNFTAFFICIIIFLNEMKWLGRRHFSFFKSNSEK